MRRLMLISTILLLGGISYVVLRGQEPPATRPPFN
jgi:hypothetical protein